MIMTVRMWNLKQRIDHLEWCATCDPGDYMITVELDELKEEFKRLDKMERFGLRVVQGGRQCINSKQFNTPESA